MVSALRQFLFFTCHFKLRPIPAEEVTIILYLEFMARTVGYSHLKHLLKTVSFVHEALNAPFPSSSFQIDNTLQGLKRRLARVPFQVLPLTPTILKEMFKHIDVRKTKDLALWCSFLAAFYGLLRKSSAVPENMNTSDRKPLLRRNIQVDEVNNMV